MGQILSTFIHLSIDWGTASLTAGLFEHIFPTYKPNASHKFLMLFEALIQLTSTVIFNSYITGLVTPSSMAGTDILGMVGVTFFSILYSPNMMAKLRSFHNNLMHVLLFTPGGWYSSQLTTPPVSQNPGPVINPPSSSYPPDSIIPPGFNPSLMPTPPGDGSINYFPW